MINRAGNRKGVTLVEVMVAMAILLIVFMGLIQASLLSIDFNMRNVLRDEGARVASESMARIRTVPFGDAVLNDTTGTASSAGVCAGSNLQPTPLQGWLNFNPNAAGIPVALQQPSFVNRGVRLFTQRYDRCMRVTNIDPQPSVKRVEIAAVWTDPKGELHTHTVTANLRAQ